jgi:UDP-glucose 4-epimerase
MRDPLPFFENNVVGPLNLARAMAGCGCRKLVFSSTCAVYGTPDAVPMNEELPLRRKAGMGVEADQRANIFLGGPHTRLYPGVSAVF